MKKNFIEKVQHNNANHNGDLVARGSEKLNPSNQRHMKKKSLKYTFLIFWWLLRPRDYQNLFRHVENPPHANYELIWFRESPVFDIFTSGVRGCHQKCEHFPGRH